MSIGGARYRAGQGRTLTTAPLPEGGFGVELALAGSPEVERVRFFREHVPTTGVIRGVDIDTSHFTGNYPPAASLEACVSEKDPDDKTAWTELLPAVSLGPSAHHFHAIATPL